MMKLLLHLSAKGKLSLQSVQSQSVDAQFLPRLMESLGKQHISTRRSPTPSPILMTQLLSKVYTLACSNKETRS